MDAARERAKKVKAAKAQQKAQQQAWFELKVNTSVYVTGLPEVGGRAWGTVLCQGFRMGRGACSSLPSAGRAGKFALVTTACNCTSPCNP